MSLNGGEERLKPSPGSFFVTAMLSSLPIATSLVAFQHGYIVVTTTLYLVNMFGGELIAF